MQETIREIPTKVFTPKTAGKQSAVVMLQEWWGITPQLEKRAQTVCDALNTKVVIPDLYNGKSTVDAEEASHMMNNLDWPKALAQVGEVADYLKTEGKCESVAVMGFCMGGALTVASSTNHDKFSAGVVFYGKPPVELADPCKCKTPQQGHFGLLDDLEGFSDPKTCDALEAAWKQAGIECAMYRYEGVGHAFMNDEAHGANKPIHDPELAKLAWSRTFEFLKKHGI